MDKKSWWRAFLQPTRLYWLVAAGLIIAALVAVQALLLHSGPAVEAADARYGGAISAECPLGPRSGPPGRHARRSAAGVPYVVVTPRNYQSGHVHPLLVVYAPAGLGPGLSERHAGLTGAATAAGYIVTYVGSLQLSLAAVERLAGVPVEVASEWCIDPNRIHAAGHSDGGTVATALAVLPEWRGRLAAVVASGMGWRAPDFAAQDCPAPMAVLIAHGSEDSHFPGYGRDAAAFWRRCNGCSDAVETDAHGCIRYRGCVAETVYCEPARSHWRWAVDAPAVMDFLQRRSLLGELDNSDRASCKRFGSAPAMQSVSGERHFEHLPFSGARDRCGSEHPVGRPVPPKRSGRVVAVVIPTWAMMLPLPARFLSLLSVLKRDVFQRFGRMPRLVGRQADAPGSRGRLANSQ
jgi:polyhydroxybutyrate depolymerase